MVRGHRHFGDGGAKISIKIMKSRNFWSFPPLDPPMKVKTLADPLGLISNARLRSACYRPQTQLREGSVSTGVCPSVILSTREVTCDHYHDVLGHGTYPLPPPTPRYQNLLSPFPCY